LFDYLKKKLPQPPADRARNAGEKGSDSRPVSVSGDGGRGGFPFQTRTRLELEGATIKNSRRTDGTFRVFGT